ncbi:bifunctional 2-polyprenyl-6-hydroxyphenol methylase/3-demethylubiquinol 3-O-methyltransferase UbiG [Acidiferrimicrobium sp. IK]|nr:bifunctional 2-polyprenyl-6-hydroxyphenol methylase/3-demethylubiquinol 3-O-methyltransferase UbiG [Acidiferrimicrobium sp. IK]MCU4183195.1 bifunctional 2-polyprenyl-6-hydroxyphenol methylase/3-demethylubiquinol 3-O-methyltransferase UbiG [Acidiferrimicrobium sp. IK]
MPLPTLRARNDPRQYDDLADAWWDPRGAFAMLHWLAEARAGLVPAAARPGAVLVDLGCGGGLLAPHLAAKGYHHVGVDVTGSALRRARDHGVTVVRADAATVPLRDEVADVVCAGEILEHVTDPAAVVAEACRLLRPGGRLVVDTIAATRLATLVAVEIAERVPGAAPAGIHDPALFVDRDALVRACAAHGVELRLRGLRPRWRELAGWAAGRRPAVTMVPVWTTAVLFQGWGTKGVGR